MPKKLDIEDDLVGLLKTSLRLEKLFPEFKREDIAAHFPHSGLYEYKTEEHIIDQGESSRDIYVVQTGKVSIAQTMGTAGAVLATLASGEIFGEIALLRDGVRVAGAVAAEPCKIFRIAYPDIESLRSGNPQLADHLEDLARQRTES